MSSDEQVAIGHEPTATHPGKNGRPIDYANSFGVIALAAFRPDPELLKRQIRSLARQRQARFECVIAADGEELETRALVAEIVGDDPRFRVIGFEKRLGFYRNFERALSSISEDARWVALADQDDLWYPEKLETLLPFLEKVALVSGQARTVEFPTGKVLEESTKRTAQPPETFLVYNQFTGSFTVFRAAVLERALPFPGSTGVEVHDLWIAMCAALLGGCDIVDRVLQDYVQHGSNEIGEPSTESSFSPLRAWHQWGAFAAKYSGSTTLRARLTTYYTMVAGRSETIALELAARFPDRPREVERLLELYGPQRRALRTAHYLRAAAREGALPRRWWLSYLTSHLSGVLVRNRQLNVS